MGSKLAEVTAAPAVVVVVVVVDELDPEELEEPELDDVAAPAADPTPDIAPVALEPVPVDADPPAALLAPELAAPDAAAAPEPAAPAAAAPAAPATPFAAAAEVDAPESTVDVVVLVDEGNELDSKSRDAAPNSDRGFVIALSNQAPADAPPDATRFSAVPATLAIGRETISSTPALHPSAKTLFAFDKLVAMFCIATPVDVTGLPNVSFDSFAIESVPTSKLSAPAVASFFDADAIALLIPSTTFPCFVAAVAVATPPLGKALVDDDVDPPAAAAAAASELTCCGIKLAQSTSNASFMAIAIFKLARLICIECFFYCNCYDLFVLFQLSDLYFFYFYICFLIKSSCLYLCECSTKPTSFSA